MSRIWDAANPLPEDFERAVHQDGWSMGWHGSLFVPGYALGRASAVHLLAKVIDCGIDRGSQVGRGTYWLVLREPSGQVHHLVDPSGLQRIFFSKTAVYGSYTTGLKALGATLSDCSHEGIVEFLNFGRFGADFSHHPELRALSGSARLEVGPGGSISLFDRNLAAPGFDPGQPAAEFFQGMADSLQGAKVSVDLTGGLDSRLVAGLLDAFGLDFETALSGADHYSEFSIAERVSRRLGKGFQRYGHDIDLIADDLRRHIRRSEGLIDGVATHRASLLQEARHSEGYDVVIGGVGGENFNDYTLVQDLPFVGRRHANLERFFDLRLNPVLMPEGLLNPTFSAVQNGFRGRILDRLEGYRGANSTATYQNIFYRHRVGPITAVQVSATQRLGMGHLMPLMDYPLFCAGYQLSMRERLASGWHRHLINDHAPAVSGIASTSGIAAYGGRMGLLRDLCGYGSNTLKRGIRKADQRLFKRAYPQESPDNLGLLPALRSTTLAAEAFDRVKAAGVLRADLKLSQLPNFWLGKVITLGVFAEILEP
jgi:hypothetical protein